MAVILYGQVHPQRRVEEKCRKGRRRAERIEKQVEPRPAQCDQCIMCS
jgi:hypothetical protein